MSFTTEPDLHTAFQRLQSVIDVILYPNQNFFIIQSTKKAAWRSGSAPGS
jgi:hypothetical protein